MNYLESLNLSKFNGASVMEIQGATTKKRCVVIPIEENYLYEGKNGIYTSLIAHERKSVGSSGDTHFLTMQIPKDKYNALTEEQRKNNPIMGNMKEVTTRSEQKATSSTTDPLNDLGW